MKKITFHSVTKKYGEKVVLDNRSIEFPDSGFVCIVGPSGIGKTTIFNLLLGIEKPDSGEILIEGLNPMQLSTLHRRVFSVVFQEDRLLPDENVLNNVIIPCITSDRSLADHSIYSKESVINRSVSILTELGLENEIDTLPSKLSGGMSRRVSIARALATEADIYLMDEPTKGLDNKTRYTVLDVIHKYTDLNKTSDHDKLLIMITHNPDDTANAHIITV